MSCQKYASSNSSNSERTHTVNKEFKMTETIIFALILTLECANNWMMNWDKLKVIEQ